MSGIGEILDRLSGVAVVTEQVAAVKSELARTLPLLVDHERRLTRIETRSESAKTAKTLEGPKRRPIR